jgi:beta-phosphoglucomutase family hydrolase
MNVNPVQQNPHMPMVLPFEGIILDMDGTLIESTEADYLAWKWLFAHYNKPFTFQQYQPLLGIKSADVIKTQLQLHGEELTYALKKKMDYFKEVVANNGIRTVPFAEALLQNLKKYPVQIALATSSRREKMRLLMEKFGFLPYFDIMVTGEEVQRGKPAPDIFTKAAQQMQLTPNKCVVIEDAANGVTAAKSAHMKCVAITTTHTADLLQHADLVIDTFENADLKEWCTILSSKF